MIDKTKIAQASAAADHDENPASTDYQRAADEAARWARENAERFAATCTDNEIARGRFNPAHREIAIEYSALKLRRRHLDAERYLRHVARRSSRAAERRVDTYIAPQLLMVPRTRSRASHRVAHAGGGSTGISSDPEPEPPGDDDAADVGFVVGPDGIATICVRVGDRVVTIDGPPPQTAEDVAALRSIARAAIAGSQNVRWLS